MVLASHFSQVLKYAPVSSRSEIYITTPGFKRSSLQLKDVNRRGNVL